MPTVTAISKDTPKIIGKVKPMAFSVLIPGTAATTCIGNINIKRAKNSLGSLKKEIRINRSDLK
ncbi:hypothetical protein [Arenibacter nanhaiticus]|uniref:hypothetical protein n=1 Tax=Arenibacter nanhaiticus TaxID=558155 RepID=UPI0009344289|nr:hypothetical protein [Arenibacter nanhaiticus]